MNTVLFHETQRMFGNVLLILIIIPFILFIIYQFRRQPLLIRVVSVITGLIGACILITLCCLGLDTLYYADRIEYQFISLFKTKYEVVTIASVRKATVILYNPEDYGGWGMKGNETTRVYNAAGNNGLLLNMNSGKNILIGTQKPDSLYAHIKGYYPF